MATGYTLITLKRLDSTEHGVFGHLTMPDFDCVTLERHDINIPCGTYPVELYDSPSRGYKVPMLKNVPNRSYIEIHSGNWETDSKGCILVGKCRDGFAINDSKMTWQAMMKHWPIGQVEIKIV